MKIVILALLIFNPILKAEMKLKEASSCGNYAFRGMVLAEKEGVYLVKNYGSLSEERFRIKSPLDRVLSQLNEGHIGAKVKLRHVKEDEIEIYALSDLTPQIENPFKSTDKMEFLEKVECEK